MKKTQTKINEKLYVSDIRTVREESVSHADVVVSACQDGTGENVGCEFKKFPLADGDAVGMYGGDDSYEGYKKAADYILDKYERGKTVHVHCHHGQSRSVSLVTSILALEKGTSWTTALNEVEDKHPMASPDKQLKKYGRRYVSERL